MLPRLSSNAGVGNLALEFLSQILLPIKDDSEQLARSGFEGLVS